MYKKFPWWKYYLLHPVEFLITCVGVCIALAWNWLEWHEDEIEALYKKLKNFFTRK